MKFGTLLLLGFTVLAGSLSGCIIETTSSGPGTGTSCLENQFFNVHWAVEQSFNVNLSCQATPPSRVVLSTNTGGLLAVGQECSESLACSDGTPCNWRGSTVDGIAEGTFVTTATLQSSDGVVLDSIQAVEAAILRCTRVELNFIFELWR